MNGRRLFRNYAKLKGKSAKSFKELKVNFGGDTLITQSEDNKEENTTVNYEEMIFMIINGKLKI